MADPTAFDQLKQSVIRYVKTGVNWRIKNTDIASDQKVIDAADISGHATSVTQVSLTTPAVGTSTNLAREDHAHKLSQAAAQSFLANPTGSTADLQAVTVAADRLVGRDASGNLGGILAKVAHLASIAANSVLANVTGGSAQPTEVVLSQNTVLGRQAGNAGAVKVSPDMKSRIVWRGYLSGTPAANADMPLTEVENASGFTYSSGRLTVPSIGRYRLTAFATVACATVGDPLMLHGLLFYYNGTTTTDWGKTWGYGLRGGPVGNNFGLGGAVVELDITNPSAQRIVFRADQPLTFPIASYGSVIVEKIGP